MHARGFEQASAAAGLRVSEMPEPLHRLECRARPRAVAVERSSPPAGRSRGS